MNNVDLIYSGADDAAISAFDDVLELYLGSKNTVMANLEPLLQNYPDMPMAHLLRCYLLKLASDPRFIPAAKGCLSTAKQLPCNNREQLHSAALSTWLDGDATKATKILEQILVEYPLDTLALKIAHHMHFYAGESEQMRDSVARVSNFYHPGHRFQGFVLGMQSFGLEEAGQYNEAEKLGRLAVEMNPQDQWAAHAVAHVMQMQSRSAEGVEWTRDLIPKWVDSNNFIFHVHWHQALFLLGQNDLDAALTVYDNELVKPLSDDFYLDVCNAASLLWRIEMLGADVGDRWEALRPYSGRATDDELIFCSLHYLMAPARLQDEKTVSRALQHMETWQESATTQGQLAAEVGKPLATAICDLAAGEYATAAQQLNAIADNVYKIGGSHAQRHLFDDMRHWAESNIS